jgi:hypothetical protein
MRTGQALSLLVLLLVAGTVAAQDGGLFGDVVGTRVTLVNPFTGSPMTVTLLRVIYIGAGAVLLLAGWSAYRLALSLAGFAVGASFGASLTAQYGAVSSLIVTVALGMLGGALAYYVYLLAVAAVGGFVGLYVTGQIVVAFSLTLSQWPLQAVYATGVIVGAGLALALAVELTVILTSAVGAVMLAGGTGLINGRFGALWTLVLFAMGVAVQIGIARARGGNPFQKREG